MEMFTERRPLVCMCCELDFDGYVDGDSELILKPECKADFRAWLAEDEERMYSLYWFNEYLRVRGNRKERRLKELGALVDALLA